MPRSSVSPKGPVGPSLDDVGAALKSPPEPAAPPKRRGRPPGSKTRPRPSQESQELPEFEMPAGLIGACIGMAFETVGARTGFPEIWALPPEQLGQLDTLGCRVAARYLPAFLREHADLVAFTAALGMALGSRIVATRAAQQARDEDDDEPGPARVQ